VLINCSQGNNIKKGRRRKTMRVDLRIRGLDEKHERKCLRGLIKERITS
jgi:hypothetical protein